MYVQLSMSLETTSNECKNLEDTLGTLLSKNTTKPGGGNDNNVQANDELQIQKEVNKCYVICFHAHVYVCVYVHICVHMSMCVRT